MGWLPPWPLTHKLVEFAIGFGLVAALAYFLGDPKPPGGRHKR